MNPAFLKLDTNWRIGGIVTALALPLLALQAAHKGSLSITTDGWSVPKVNGLFSRVKLFLKNAEIFNNVAATSQTSGGGTFQVSQVGLNSAATNWILDLIVEIPSSKLGQIENYKYCLTESSKLRRKNLMKKIDDSKSSNCELKYFSKTSDNGVDSESINYLLDLITKYISVQHVANMLLFYDSKINFSGSSQRLKKIAVSCGLIDSKEQNIIQGLFLQSTKSSKKCLPSPSEVVLNLRLPSERSTSTIDLAENSDENQINKSKLTRGGLKGYLKYGIFDYWTTDLIPIPKNEDEGQRKGKGIRIDFPINYSLSEISLEKCSLDGFHRSVLKQEMKLEKLSNCAF